MSQYADLIGIPFAYGGRDENALDCYGLLMLLHRRRGIEIKDFPSSSNGAEITAMMMGNLHLWKTCELKEGASILFRVPGNLHVGYFIGNGKFIHTWEKSGGVVIEPLSVWSNKIMGVYEYVGEN